jgi:flavin reductase (DIM6/NTAB) family NADH-FMN oxidoreductase RutF
MAKVLMGPQTWLYPMPALLVGSNVAGRANFMTVAWGGIANGEPPMLSLAIRHSRHTLKGIRQNLAFSVNVPGGDMVRETDYCGLESGARADKVEVCGFKVFYGKLENAPLIEQCPLNLGCRVVQILNLGSHALVIGRIEETHVVESCLTDGKPDVTKMRPFLYATTPEGHYRALGEVIARAFSVGKGLKRGKGASPE